MNNPKLYTVKEAAKIIGVSTNTLYKYLDDGKIHAARGSAIQGRFRIPESALEEFLGVTLSTPEMESSVPVPLPQVSQNSEPSIPLERNHKPHLPLKIARFFLLIALIAILTDLFIARTISLPAILTRLSFVVVMLLLAYQEGGYRRG